VNSLLEQLKKRRKELGLKQNDMKLRVGMSPQQYQKLESVGNPRLDTLELIAKGLRSELLLIPQEKLTAVKAVLSQKESNPINEDTHIPNIAEDPWKGILGDDE
jgi:transcriptional regulator with XRE-family HTH domain